MEAQGMQCHRITLLALELTEALVCSLLFFSRSLDCISVAWKKCVIPLSEPVDDHRPRLKWFRRSWCIRGAEGGIVTDLSYSARTIFLDNIKMVTPPKKNYLFLRTLSSRTDVHSVRSLHSSRITTPWGKPSNLWTLWVYPLRRRVPSWTWIRCM